MKPGIVEAFKLSVEQNWEWTLLIFETLAGLFTRDTSVKQLMGPVASPTCPARRRRPA